MPDNKQTPSAIEGVLLPDGTLRDALSEIAGIASQRGSDKSMFSIEDFKRLGEIERLARRVLRGTDK